MHLVYHGLQISMIKIPVIWNYFLLHICFVCFDKKFYITATPESAPSNVSAYLRFRSACAFVVWSESSLGAFCVAKDARFLRADNEDSIQTERKHRLIWVFVLRTRQKVRFLNVATYIIQILSNKVRLPWKPVSHLSAHSNRSKHCGSCITNWYHALTVWIPVRSTKTRLFKYIANLISKSWKFSDKKFWYFFISAQNIDCGYSFEQLRRVRSNEYQQSMFLSN